jgi:tRNA(Ile)-lysidine synthase
MANSKAERTAKRSFAVAQLLKRLTFFPDPSRYWVGFSGGADSTALLIALNEAKKNLAAQFRAIHFNHGLQSEASSWQAHCVAFCKQRNIPIDVYRLELHLTEGKSPEEQARHQRYAAIERLMSEGEIYLTAHHADDNAETFFLNLMRGSGMDGLAAIPPLRRLGKGWVARPLLEYQRKDLELFLRQRDISWLEDPSNRDLMFDRNYIRNQVLPDLDKRWPGVSKRLNQSAVHARNFTTILSDLLAERYGDLLLDRHTMAVEPLLCLEPEMQAMLLRHWLRDQEMVSPPQKRLREFLVQLNASKGKGTQPELRWAQWQIKRHGKLLWLHRRSVPGICPSRTWASEMRTDLGPEFGTVSLAGDAMVVPENWEVAPRRKAASIRLHPGGPRRKLKELLREQGVPPWLRSAIPVLYWRGEAAAVGDWLLSDELQRFLSHHRMVYTWSPNDPLLCKLQSVSVHFLEQRNH